MILQLIGLLGTGLYVLAYALLQSGRLRPEQRRYSALNGGAAVLLLISLTETFHLASAVSNFVWLALSIQGYMRAMRARPQVLLTEEPDLLTLAAAEVAVVTGVELHQLVPEQHAEPTASPVPIRIDS